MNQLTLPMSVPAKRAMMPAEPILRQASIEKVGDVTYRWSATRAWGPGRTILWMLLNPSVADDLRDDPTMLRMIGFSYRWGYGSMVVVNAYPFVSSTTDRLRAWRKTWDHKTYEANGMRPWPFDRSSWSAFHHNLRNISGLIQDDTVVIAAWGAGLPEADLQQIRRGVWRNVDSLEHDGFLGPTEIDWWCIGKTKGGAPIHPLARGRHRVPDDAKPRIWKIAYRSRKDAGDY